MKTDCTLALAGARTQAIAALPALWSTARDDSGRLKLPGPEPAKVPRLHKVGLRHVSWTHIRTQSACLTTGENSSYVMHALSLMVQREDSMRPRIAQEISYD